SARSLDFHRLDRAVRAAGYAPARHRWQGADRKRLWSGRDQLDRRRRAARRFRGRTGGGRAAPGPEPLRVARGEPFWAPDGYERATRLRRPATPGRIGLPGP